MKDLLVTDSLLFFFSICSLIGSEDLADIVEVPSWCCTNGIGSLDQ